MREAHFTLDGVELPTGIPGQLHEHLRPTNAACHGKQNQRRRADRRAVPMIVWSSYVLYTVTSAAAATVP